MTIKHCPKCRCEWEDRFEYCPQCGDKLEAIQLAKYTLGFEPNKLTKIIMDVKSLLEEIYPDKQIDVSNLNQELQGILISLCDVLGYSSIEEFLRAYGFCCYSKDKSGANQCRSKISIEELDEQCSNKSVISDINDSKVNYAKEEVPKNRKTHGLKPIKLATIISVIIAAVSLVYILHDNDKPTFYSGSDNYTSGVSITETSNGLIYDISYSA